MRPADPFDTGPLEIDPLGAVLAGLLRTPGARAAHVVDGRRGVIVAGMGTTAGSDGPAVVQLARAAVPVAAQGDALDDMVVTTRGSVHLLRECEEPGTFLHVRLDRERGDVAAAQRALRVAGLQQSVQAVRLRVEGGRVAPAAPVAPRPVPSPTPRVTWFGPPAAEPVRPALAPDAVPISEPVPAVAAIPAATPLVVAAPVSITQAMAPPVPAFLVGTPAAPLPRRIPAPAEQQPALVTLTGLRPPPRTGALAVLALQEVESQEAERAQLLPRRLPSPRPRTVGVAGDSVLKQVWAEDLDALRRVLAGLRRLA